ncbi:MULTISPECIES: class I SAM-dependent methyltransferase [Fischerella]|uniref:Class I SAM-dependent methyltransferase n=1 Tax=Fischerella muscicola CCMEE 5323 TaxID=2019572 RepID=A0A2N6K3R3_FISMU|nr:MULTISPECIES: class I SAM-dependent methyltransferase [Fischerella]MBD2430017.1 class I SAM-dependent methyltransferase [Fischerella sp. FACHB-380]PLZ90301.1 class I SAM-dependent methyltransferase [Fischerella muscicola CCMEE 5323]
MKNLKEIIASYSNKDLEHRKNWYSPAAEAYNKTRPRYPQDLIRQVVEITQLSSNSKILEVGCGPATATVAFAQLGCSILSLEPNTDFYQLAQQNCQQYPNVEIQNTSFEEWMLETEKFDAVLAASSFHWIPMEVGYPKAAKALKKNGYLILLWNKELQPRYRVYQRLSEVYQIHAPSLNRYEDRKTQEDILRGLGQMIIDSGQFKDLVAGNVESEVIYTVDEYLTLLNTYSPYLKLEPQNKEALFTGLRDRIEHEFGGSLHLSYISAFHIAQKCQ